jgi:phospholipid/cholesterol/gamma-HCH transport system ATP-binding protein
VIELENVKKSFGGHEVLKGVSLKIPQGSTRVILGISGSGKTVLMKHIIGLLKPDSGRIVIDGVEITSFDDKELLEVRRKFGMVFQQSALFDSMTVFENVAFPLREHKKMTDDEIAKRVMEKLGLVSLTEAAGKYPSELSGGMKKRVALARAIVLEPQYVLYDEPTTGLDPIMTEGVDQMILDAQKRIHVTSVVISHDVGSALRVADDIAVIHEGVIIEDCKASEIRQSKHPFVQHFLNIWFEKA